MDIPRTGTRIRFRVPGKGEPVRVPENPEPIPTLCERTVEGFVNISLCLKMHKNGLWSGFRVYGNGTRNPDTPSLDETSKILKGFIHTRLWNRFIIWGTITDKKSYFSGMWLKLHKKKELEWGISPTAYALYFFLFEVTFINSRGKQTFLKSSYFYAVSLKRKYSVYSSCFFFK